MLSFASASLFSPLFTNNEQGVTTEKLMLSDDICNSAITMDEIQTHLKKLRNNKAAGIDGLCGEFFKYAFEQIAPLLFSLFNCIFDKGEWPTKWSEGIINPIHKKSSINETDNCGKITVMPVLSNVLESILNSRL